MRRDAFNDQHILYSSPKRDLDNSYHLSDDGNQSDQSDEDLLPVQHKNKRRRIENDIPQKQQDDIQHPFLPPPPSPPTPTVMSDDDDRKVEYGHLMDDGKSERGDDEKVSQLSQVFSNQCIHDRERKIDHNGGGGADANNPNLSQSHDHVALSPPSLPPSQTQPNEHQPQARIRNNPPCSGSFNISLGLSPDPIPIPAAYVVIPKCSRFGNHRVDDSDISPLVHMDAELPAPLPAAIPAVSPPPLIAAATAPIVPPVIAPPLRHPAIIAPSNAARVLRIRSSNGRAVVLRPAVAYDDAAARAGRAARVRDLGGPADDDDDAEEEYDDAFEEKKSEYADEYGDEMKDEEKKFVYDDAAMPRVGRPPLVNKNKFEARLRDRSCRHCGAYLFTDETPGWCCRNGKNLPRNNGKYLPPLPPDLKTMMKDKEFQDLMNAYNTQFAFTHLCVSDKWVTFHDHEGFVTVLGRTYHVASDVKHSNIAQMILYDKEFKTPERMDSEQRQKYEEGLDTIQDVISTHHVFASSLRTVRSQLDEIPEDQREVLFVAFFLSYF